MSNSTTITEVNLPGLNCGLCGYRSCEDFAPQIAARPELIKRCIHLSSNKVSSKTASNAAGFNANSTAPSSSQTYGNFSVSPNPVSTSLLAKESSCQSCGVSCKSTSSDSALNLSASDAWKDSLGREFDFYLEHFPEDPGPREVMIPHNPMLTREMNIQVGDILIGRPLGMSCGCPITHCGVAMEVDVRTGVIVWCVTGPLAPREKGFKDLGYYIAEAYEGIIKETRTEIKIGMRYFFQPKMCMLQWRHSGLVNYINKTNEGLQIRIEGLWIG